MPDTIGGYQAETERQETHVSKFLKFPNIPTDTKTITFEEYPDLGVLLIHDKTNPHIIAMAYLLGVLGASMQLSYCNETALWVVLQVFKQKPIQSLKQEMCGDLYKDDIMKFYRHWTKRLAILAHVCFSKANVNI